MTVYDDNTNFAFAEPSTPVLPPHTVTWVCDPDGDEPPFAYTTGLAARPGRAYELAATGLPGPVAHAVITNAAEQLVADGLDPADGLELDEVLEGGYVVRLRRVADTSGCTGARAVYGPDVAVWQVLVPDKWGLVPGDPHYAEAAAQPLM
ncbi:DUF4262 domain-containing protein [Streptomyces chrestomyceticus]|uniref:DUF4262 domain-containing protein n=1 Tax=Streptomyces chrestomyceticus TaxID=68185 RepID=UPI0033CDA07D